MMGDELDPARGILFAVVISVVFWLIVGVVLWWLL